AGRARDGQRRLRGLGQRQDGRGRDGTAAASDQIALSRGAAPLHRGPVGAGFSGQQKSLDVHGSRQRRALKRMKSEAVKGRSDLPAPSAVKKSRPQNVNCLRRTTILKS